MTENFLAALKARVSHSRLNPTSPPELQNNPYSPSNSLGDDLENNASPPATTLGRRRALSSSTDDAETRMRYMMVNLMVYMRAQEQQRFRKNLHERLVMCILSPNLTAYLTGLSDHIMSLICNNPDLFGISRSIIDSAGTLVTIQSIVKDELTTIRASLKHKILVSLGGIDKNGRVKKPQDIRALVKAIAPTGMDIRPNHWSRIAFLRASYTGLKQRLQASGQSCQEDDSDKSDTASNATRSQEDEHGTTNSPTGALDATTSGSSTTSGTTSGQPPAQNIADNAASDSIDGGEWIEIKDRTYTWANYWKYVDDALHEARLTIRKTPDLSPQQEQQCWTSFFTLFHQEDLKAYPITNAIDTAGLGNSEVGFSLSTTSASCQQRLDSSLSW
ncbi:hypothetical protein BD779DRAFT_1478342 [Infundibulicybe gibba]|nr:hypothetical protein BD779DRAFT_1478342 [Infundibulicybe gibba]